MKRHIAEAIWGVVSGLEEPHEINIRIATTGFTEVPSLALELLQCSFTPGLHIKYDKEIVQSLHIYSGFPSTVTDEKSWTEALALGKTLNDIKRSVVMPPNSKKPVQLARYLETLAPQNVQTEYLDLQDFPLVEAVGQSSPALSRVVKYDYRPNTAPDTKVPHVVLVGKGVTFDTGGLCLKPEAYMTDMKNDMTGAAMAANICFLVAKLGLNVRVTTVIGLAENLLSDTCMKPSDVYTSRNGKTVEISDTDAEGRLLLADMLQYASELKPDAILDMATLTGAAVAALGEKITTVLTNSDELWQSIEFASKQADERMWRLPLEEAYADALKSKVADLKNYGKGPGAITAGLFLKEFVGEDIKWAHFDLSACGETADEPTAAGTQTILKLLSHL